MQTASRMTANASPAISDCAGARIGSFTERRSLPSSAHSMRRRINRYPLICSLVVGWYTIPDDDMYWSRRGPSAIHSQPLEAVDMTPRPEIRRIAW